ncbi:MAG: RNA polymerase sigma factor [Opitutales bacterium]|nr:RNA polymerase sigma factor [Opitutales bacterium]
MNPETFTRVVDEWHEPLYRFALSLCRNPDDALDHTQNAFHKLAVKAHTIRDKSKVKTWLFSVLYRDFADRYRRNKRHPSTPLDCLAEQAEEPPAEAGRAVDTDRLLVLLAGMEEPYRAPLVLFYMRSFSYKEIAETLDVPIGTVMSRLRRAKDQLRSRFESDEAEPANGDENPALPPPIPFKKRA